MTNQVIHYLKTWPEYFSAVKRGDKPFEVRKNNRGFDAGHYLCLQEFEPNAGAYTGDTCWKKVTYILKGPAFGIEAGFCVMGLGLPIGVNWDD